MGISLYIDSVDVVAEINYPERFMVAPTINGVATTEAALTAATGQAVLSARVTLNALDIVTAGKRIKDRFPDVFNVEVGSTVVKESKLASVPITKLYITGLSTAANVGGNVIAISETDEILIRAELLVFEFDAVDNVRTIEISIGSSRTSGTVTEAPENVVLRVVGYSHA